jgi:cellulose synthase/poly-beta-1,6-N-acetylglucosamine synthase-like glycosyltransferase
VIDKDNGGKADALNAGLNATRTDYFCAVDADAVLDEDALIRVAGPILEDPETVVATGGIVRIANGCRITNGRVTDVRLSANRLVGIQIVEYIRAFLIGRVTWSRLHSLLIISGAFGLFRRDVVERIGGYARDTIGEDMELVMRLHRHLREHGERYRIEFVADPVCWTEAPETLRVLGRQRRRWQSGLTESLWRHRRMMFDRTYGSVGFLAYPYFVLFEFLGPFIELASYAIVPFAAATGLLSVTVLMAFLVASVLLGLVMSIAALTLEEFGFNRLSGAEVRRLIGLAVLETFGYRQILAWHRVRGTIDAIRGRTSWGAMPRVGLGLNADDTALPAGISQAPV